MHHFEGDQGVRSPSTFKIMIGQHHYYQINILKNDE